MKRMTKLLALFLTACMLFSISTFTAFAEANTGYALFDCGLSGEHTHGRECLTDAAEADVASVEAKLNVPTLKEIQDARSTTYAKKNFDNDQKHAAAAYDAYVEESFAARNEAQAAYDALADQLKPFVAAELYERLAKLETVLNPVTYEITKGSNEYGFQSVYSPAYEMSGHMVSGDGGKSNSIPQTLLIVDADKDYTWSPDGVYSFAESNYEVLYCCDYETGYVGGIHYKRMNLEDSDYYDEESAAHIRAIVTNSYPYVSLEQMKENLKNEGFEDADKLSRAEVIAAVQVAIWAYANGTTELEYSQTFDVAKNTQWGTVLHDYSNEMFNWWEVGKRKFYADEEVGDRINRLIDHLKNLSEMYIDKNEIVITDVQVVNSAPVQEKDGFYKIAMEVALNNSGSSTLDEIYLSAYVDGVEVKTQKVELGKEVYNLTVEAENGKEIRVEVYGNQILPAGVYFYQPEGGRDISQCLVGVAKGETPVFSGSAIVVDVEETIALGDILIQKADENGAPLTGAEFALYAKNSKGSIFVEDYVPDENGQITISNLIPGEYELEETVAAEGYYKLEERIEFSVSEEDGAVTITSTADGATIEASNGLYIMTVTNIRIPTINDTVTVSGNKIWNDEGYEDKRPESTTIRVLGDGVEVAEKVVGEADGWQWSFELPKYREDMTEIVYTIVEDPVEGYTAEYDGYNVINTYVPEEDNGGADDEAPDAPPQTGDAPVAVLFILTVLSGAALVLLKKRKNIM